MKELNFSLQRFYQPLFPTNQIATWQCTVVGRERKPDCTSPWNRKRVILCPEIQYRMENQTDKVTQYYWDLFLWKFLRRPLDLEIWAGGQAYPGKLVLLQQNSKRRAEWNLPSCEDTRSFQCDLTSASLGSFWTCACGFVITLQTHIWTWVYNLLDSLVLHTYWNFSPLCLTPMASLPCTPGLASLQVMFILCEIILS